MTLPIINLHDFVRNFKAQEKAAMTNPQTLVEQLESRVAMPDGNEERFAGFGVMGLPFQSGHILALRRFPASSIGPGYTSVWHRSPSGFWTFVSDVDPHVSCARFFGSAIDRVESGSIILRWVDPWRLVIDAPVAELSWEICLGDSHATHLMSRIAGTLPDPCWNQPTALFAIGAIGGRVFDAGRLRLAGQTPNGQHFRATPRRIWLVTGSSAHVGGIDVGNPGPLPSQARLGDFFIPQRGLFVAGAAFFSGSTDEHGIPTCKTESRKDAPRGSQSSGRRPRR